jgi:hypothetical protein
MSENSKQAGRYLRKSQMYRGNVLHQDADIVISGILVVRYHVKKIQDMSSRTMGLTKE